MGPITDSKLQQNTMVAAVCGWGTSSLHEDRKKKGEEKRERVRDSEQKRQTDTQTEETKRTETKGRARDETLRTQIPTCLLFLARSPLLKFGEPPKIIWRSSVHPTSL